MRQFKRASLELKGFDEFLENLQAAGKTMENEGRKCFEHCAENMYDELYEKGSQAGLPEHLLEQIEEHLVENKHHNIWRAEIGWKKQKPSNGGELPDTYKVMFFNYGTPTRTTAKGYNRGAESAHPQGSSGFIKKAKLAAANRNKKLQKDTLERILRELE